MTATTKTTPLPDPGIAQPRILVADPVAQDGVLRLREVAEVDVATGLSPSDLLARIGDYDALVVRSETQVTAEVLRAGSKLRVIGRAGVGIDNIDLDAATLCGVLVLNAPTGNTIAAAEHTIALMLAMARNIAAADLSLHSGRWERKQFMGTEMCNKTLGIVGLGKIGFTVAHIAQAGLGMHILAHDPLATTDRAEQVGATLCDLDTLLQDSDVVTVHVPLNDHTRGMIGALQLEHMKPTARIINAARSGIIDEQALANALDQGRIAGAAIDVWSPEPPPTDHPLLHIPQVLVTPHLGASTKEAQVGVAADVADQIVDFLRGGTPRSAVNAPALRPEELAQLRPYLTLAQRMGSMAAQLCGSGIERIVCSYAGELAEVDTALVSAEVLRGLFCHFTDTRINVINAKAVARSLGVDVDEYRTTRELDHANALVIEVIGKQRLRLVGTQFDGEPHITRIDDFRIDMQPEGIFLVDTHEDRPGVVAGISSLLAKHDINIARLELGRDRPRGRAMMLMQVDDLVPPELLREIAEAAHLEKLIVVDLH